MSRSNSRSARASISGGGRPAPSSPRRVTPAVSISGSYQIQRTEVFNNSVSPQDQLLIDRAFPQVRLSSFQASIAHDTRNDPADASSGNLFSVDAQLAARAIGSEIGFVKSRYTAQMFRTLPGSRRMVFAGSARLGLATGFPREIVDARGQRADGRRARHELALLRRR